LVEQLRDMLVLADRGGKAIRKNCCMATVFTSGMTSEKALSVPSSTTA
jgi:hypothetical protein